MKKSKPYLFTLLFDENDSRHRQAVEILNKKGRKKAQYITDAILNYENLESSKKKNNTLTEIAVENIRETLMDFRKM